jgi:predicted GH43/DUF377 family glycosyl hydrolase
MWAKIVGWILFASLVLVPFQVLATAAGSTTTSGTQQACVRYLGNPVINQYPFPGSNGTFRESVLPNGSTFDMWYTVEVGSYLAIGYAHSNDGISWSSSQSPVLEHGTSGSWDSGGVYSPSVVWNGSYYLMYFTGVQNTLSSRSIGMAYSRDAIRWREFPRNPVLVPGPGQYDSTYVRSSDVLYDGHEFRMWYSGAPSSNSSTPRGYPVAIDFATSPDGINWTKYAENPVLTGDGWPAGADTPSVVEVNGTYVMAFGTSYITYAISSDGAHWNWDRFDLLEGTNIPSDWEGFAIDPSIVIANSTMMLWYAGTGFWTPPQPPAPHPAIGLAYCPLVVVSTKTVVTTTLESLTTYTTTDTRTITSTYSTSNQFVSPGLPILELALVALGLSLVASTALLYRMKHTRY